MTYISRRLSVTNNESEDIEYSDNDFFAFPRPLIILGEPGAGKSELVENFAAKTKSPFYTASSIKLHSEIHEVALPKRIIIDGVDEITAYESGPSIANILSKFSSHDSPNFVMTCRIVDWQGGANTAMISDRWGIDPLIGRLLPLNDSEIVEFVNLYSESIDGERFIEAAKEHDVVELLSNPQNLIMLLKSVETEGWPNSRCKLYENASNALVKESNPFHESINKERPNDQSLINASGFICAQLLLSNNAQINSDVGEDAPLPKIKDLGSTELDIQLIRFALSTKIFRVSNGNNLEACHRTVAEFLAAKWISGALRGALSIKRLENLLYSTNKLVPSSLRGLHAWIATLHKPIAELFITRDPYGFFRYGDPKKLTDSQAKHLLKCMESVAAFDPYFRSEDWNAVFGKGVARKELSNDIVRIIRNPKSPYQLSHLLIECIKGSDVVDAIYTDLLEIIIDKDLTFIERDECVDALLNADLNTDWKDIINKLYALNDIGSLRLVFIILNNKTDLFSGHEIANALIKLAEHNSSEKGPRYYGIGHNTHNKMTVEQLDSCLTELTKYKFDRRENEGGDIEEWMYDLIEERLSNAPLPNEHAILSWLLKLNRHSYYKSSWDKFSSQFFSSNPELKQKIQIAALSSAKDENQYWKILFMLRHDHPGLALTEDDYIFHMNEIVSNREENQDWFIRWRHLVHLVKMHTYFTGEAVSRAKQQTQSHPELQEILTEMEKPSEYEAQEREYERKDRRRRRQRKNVTQKSYELVKDEIVSGEHLQAISNISEAYLGRFSDSSGETPKERVRDLVGEKMTDAACLGLAAAMKRDDFPAPREMTSIRAKENKQYCFESILTAHCLDYLLAEKSFHEIPINIAKSALAACQWGMGFSDNYTSEIQLKLEEVVFSDEDSKEQFIRDTMEPYLEVGAEHISGMYRIVREELFANVMSALSIEWINKYDNLSNNTLHELIAAAILNAPEKEVKELVKQKIASNKWKNDFEKAAWYGAAFIVDFELHENALAAFAKEDRNNLWVFRDILSYDHAGNTKQPMLDVRQHNFLATLFCPEWPLTQHPSSSSGDKNLWDASDYLIRRINSIAADVSDEAEIFLSKLIAQSGLESYQNLIKHVYAQQMRKRAEANKNVLDFGGVRNILLSSSPENQDDLQALLLDELEALQDRIRNGPTNDVQPFWNGDIPHDENYCRDRIASALTPSLDKYNIRCHTEGTMPDSERCDLLNTYNMFDVPIEIKGQWHTDIWTAATSQLENYTREYRAAGRGIYLVLWFGYLEANNPKNPHGWAGQKMPKSLNEMNRLLEIKYPDLPEMTKIIVFDLSKIEK